MKKFKYLLVSVFLLTNTIIYAHTGLKSSIPGNQTVLNKSPEMVVLEFNTEVRLIKLTLIKSEDREKIELDFQSKMNLASNFSQSLPKLVSGKYTVKWLAMGKDAHKMKGQFSFILRTTSDEIETN